MPFPINAKLIRKLQYRLFLAPRHNLLNIDFLFVSLAKFQERQPGFFRLLFKQTPLFAIKIVQLDQVEDPSVKRVHLELAFYFGVRDPGTVALVEFVEIRERVLGERAASHKDQSVFLAEAIDGLLEGEVTGVGSPMHVLLFELLIPLRL